MEDAHQTSSEVKDDYGPENLADVGEAGSTTQNSLSTYTIADSRKDSDEQSSAKQSTPTTREYCSPVTEGDGHETVGTVTSGTSYSETADLTRSQRHNSGSAGEDRPLKRKRKSTARAETAAERNARELADFLEARRDDRIAGRMPASRILPKRLVEEAKQSNDSKNYKQALNELSDENPTIEQIAEIEKAKTRGPNYLGRTASRSSGIRFDISKPGSNGFTSQNLMMPAADTHRDQALHSQLADFTQGELVYMIGQHLIWNDIRGDEFLSYSKDPLFLVVHALDRYHENQGDVTVYFFDRRTAEDVKGDPAAFYPALDFYDAFEVPSWSGWRRLYPGRLYPRKFTQEFLSHGTVLNKDDRLQGASIDRLLQDGLYEIFPFQVPGDHRRAGLYTGQVIYRRVGYPPEEPIRKLRYPRIYSYKRCARLVPFTTSFLEKVQKLTKNFMNVANFDNSAICEPHLHIFLSFLTFEKRPQRDETFLGWIKTHYSPIDVTDLYDDGNGGVRPGFTDVADNLPGVMQYLDLVRDAAFAFGLPGIPLNIIETRNALTGRYYASEDAERHKKDVFSSEKYDRDAQRDKRDKNSHARKAKKDGKVASAGLDAFLIASHPETEETPTILEQGLVATTKTTSIEEVLDSSNGLDPIPSALLNGMGDEAATRDQTVEAVSQVEIQHEHPEDSAQPTRVLGEAEIGEEVIETNSQTAEIGEAASEEAVRDQNLLSLA